MYLDRPARLGDDQRVPADGCPHLASGVFAHQESRRAIGIWAALVSSPRRGRDRAIWLLFRVFVLAAALFAVALFAVARRVVRTELTLRDALMR